MKKGLAYYRESLFTGPLVFLYLVIFLYSFSFQLLMTPLTSMGLSLGISGVVLGLIANTYEFSCMAARDPAGRLIDAGKLKQAVCIGFLMICVTSLLYMAASTPVIYGIVRFLNGFTAGYTGAVFTALLPAAVDHALVGTATAIYTAISALGNAYAPALSKYLFTEKGFPQAYAAVLILSLAAAALVWLCMPQISCPSLPAAADKPKEQPEKKGLHGISLKLLPICSIGALVNITKDMNAFYTVQLGLDLGIDVTTGIALAGTLSVGIGVAAGILIDHGKMEKVMIFSLICLVCSNFLYGNAVSMEMATAAAITYRIGICGYWPALIALCCYALPARKGTAVATLYFFLDVISLVNNTVLGFLYDFVGVRLMYQTVGAINILAIIYFILINKYYMVRLLEKTPRLTEGEMNDDKGKNDL